MSEIKAYKITEEEFTDVTGGIENVEDLYKWGGFFFSQSEGFNGNKLYYAINHFLMVDIIDPVYFLVTKELIHEVGKCIKEPNREYKDEAMLSLLIESNILKI